jgi:beta-mannosidase
MAEPANNILLNGLWKYIPDPETRLNIQQAKDLLLKNDVSEMHIPSNWENEGLCNHNGSVWFLKEFDLSDTSALNILRFSGVDYFADIWVNDVYLGKHEGYFQPFFFDISGICTGNNQLIVKVTSPFEEPGKEWPLRKKLIKGIFNHHDCRPGGWDYKKGQDKNTGGIWNDVSILTGDPVFIKGIKATSKPEIDKSKATLIFEISYYFNGISALDSNLKIVITSPSGTITQITSNVLFQKDKDKTDVTVVIDNPELWWPNDLGEPLLYDITITSGSFEKQSFKYGIREVRLDDKKQFFINGKRLFLRGTNIIPEQFLSILSRDRIKELVTLIREANINIVRVHAHVNRPELYEEFDRQGILVWQDFALQWTYDESPEFISNAVSQIKDMARLLYNHASVCFWCCHNEPGEQIHVLDHFLKNAVLSEDQTRIIRTASNYEEHPYDGWYWGNKEHFAAAPMGPLVTEFGAQALPIRETMGKMFTAGELFPPDYNKWQYHNFQPDQTFNIAKIDTGNSIDRFINNSQNYQAELLKTAVEFYRRKRFDNITGIFQFMFIDCWPSITWSVIDYYGNKKAGYKILQKVFEPLFISINLRQDQYYQGKKLLLDIYIINDLHIDFTNCNLVFFLDGNEIESLTDITVNKDDIFIINYENININLSDDIAKGRHIISTRLQQNTNTAAENSFSFIVV